MARVTAAGLPPVKAPWIVGRPALLEHAAADYLNELARQRPWTRARAVASAWPRRRAGPHLYPRMSKRTPETFRGEMCQTHVRTPDKSEETLVAAFDTSCEIRISLN